MGPLAYMYWLSAVGDCFYLELFWENSRDLINMMDAVDETFFYVDE